MATSSIVIATLLRARHLQFDALESFEQGSYLHEYSQNPLGFPSVCLLAIIVSHIMHLPYFPCSRTWNLKLDCPRNTVVQLFSCSILITLYIDFMYYVVGQAVFSSFFLRFV